MQSLSLRVNVLGLWESWSSNTKKITTQIGLNLFFLAEIKIYSRPNKIWKVKEAGLQKLARSSDIISWTQFCLKTSEYILPVSQENILDFVTNIVWVAPP